MTELVTFLNRNTDRELERRLLAMLAGLLAADPRHAGELARFLDPRLAVLLDLAPVPPPPTAPTRREHPRLALLYALLAIGVAAIPALCLAIATFGAVPGTPVVFGLLQRWVAAFNAVFAIYAVSLNGSYLLLLAFSVAGSRGRHGSRRCSTSRCCSPRASCPRCPSSARPSTRRPRSWRASAPCSTCATPTSR